MSHFVFVLFLHPLMANSLFIKATHRFTKKGKHHISFCPPYVSGGQLSILGSTTVVITVPEVPVTGISCSPEIFEMPITQSLYEQKNFMVKIEPADASNQNYYFEGADDNAISAYEPKSGMFVNAGLYRMKVVSESNSDVYTTFQVEVVQPVTSLNLSSTTFYAQVGDNIKNLVSPSVHIEPEEASNKDFYIEYPSDDAFTNDVADMSGEYPIKVVSSDNPDYNGRISINKIDQKVYGDTNLEVFGTNKQGSDYVIWEGGSFGEVTMGKDSYGDDAIVMKSTGPNPTGDAYTAITLADGIAYDWSDAKGVTLWARNDSETEISFNIQLDCLVDVDGDGTRDRGRFNVRQGFQFWLYDLNTGKDTIYMTRPEITLPVGFEGWIRVPFEAFLQADWSLVDPNHKVIPRNYFMAEGSVVGYLAITIDSRAYAGQTFAVNKIGSYKTTPVLTTAIIKDDSKSIRKLMGLE